MEGTVNPASGERNSLTDLNAREHAGEPKHRDAHVASSPQFDRTIRRETAPCGVVSRAK